MTETNETPGRMRPRDLSHSLVLGCHNVAHRSVKKTGAKASAFLRPRDGVIVSLWGAHNAANRKKKKKRSQKVVSHRNFLSLNINATGHLS